MPLQAPNLDDRRFEDLVREVQLRIPRYTPEWTDFNESDPGFTLVQLFAWLTEMMLYRLNRLPERNYIKFLQLLNMELRPAQPARAHLTFTAQEGAAPVSVPQGFPVAAQPPDGGDLLVFETEEGVDLIRLKLDSVQVTDEAGFEDRSPDNQASGMPFHPLGWLPQIGNALYLGFAQTNPPATGRLFPQVMRFYVFLPPTTQQPQLQRCRAGTPPPVPPVDLEWEYLPAEGAPWRRLEVFRDETESFTREGYLLVEGPSAITASRLGRVTDPRYWIRARLAGRSYPAGQTPVIDFIRANTVPAIQLVTARDELVGISSGLPNQVFTLRNTPVQPGSLRLWIEPQGVDPELWTPVDDLFTTGADDPYYTLSPATGEIRFGDGRHGRIPVAGADVVAREYRYGGGEAGNVRDGLINAPLTNLTGLDKVTNERPAVGGRDEQSLEDLKREAPQALRHRGRAVTPEDFAALALEAGGVARAMALALAHPDHPEVAVPGAITVVIVPDSEEVPPTPSSELIRSVCAYLDRFRLVTTEVYVTAPDYKEIRVQAIVEAQPYAAFDAVRRAVSEALNAYLHPLRPRRDAQRAAQSDRPGPLGPEPGDGETGGWPFGYDLHPTTLFGVILRVPDVVAVPQLTLTVNGQPHDSLRDPVILSPGGLLFGASDHQITVRPLADR